jgi:hypothetical protein
VGAVYPEEFPLDFDLVFWRAALLSDAYGLSPLELFPLVLFFLFDEEEC